MRRHSSGTSRDRQASNGFRQPYTQPPPAMRQAKKAHLPPDQSPTKQVTDPDSTINFVHEKSTGNFFVMPRVWFATRLTKLDALFLQDLINRAESPKVRWSKDGQWFKCTTKFLNRNSVEWSKDEQHTRFRSL